MARNDKIFYENAGAGIYNAAWNTGSGGWLNTNYRQITLEKPATGELKTWLEANAVRLPLTGTWVFNSKLSDPSGLGSATIVWPVNFKCSLSGISSIITSITLGLNSSTDKLQITYTGYPEGTSSNVTSSTVVYGSTAGTWVNQAYRTITFTEPVQYQGNEEFVRWFVDNAVPVEKGINYLLNDSIRGTTSYTANVSRYDFKKTQLSPLFENVSFKYKGKEFTEIYCSGYLHRSQLSTGSGSKKRYMNSSTLHINLSFTNGDYTVGIASNNATNRTAWQSSSSSYPSYPTGLDLNTKDIILSFDTAPTGSFLTWLNEHATLIPTTK